MMLQIFLQGGVLLYAVVAVVLLLSELAYFRVAEHFGITDRPGYCKPHERAVTRGGGIVYFLSAVMFFLLSGGLYPWFAAGLLCVALVSFMDDVHSLRPRLRLWLHFAGVALLLADTGLYVQVPWWLLPGVMFVCAGIINVYNFMDGINGMLGVYSVSVLGVLWFVNEHICEFADSRLIGFTLMAALVFSFFNVRRKARCFAGDVGAICAGFITTFLLMRLMARTGDASWIVFLAVYGVDGVLTLLHRLWLREDVSTAHRKNAFHLLADQLKVPHVLVSVSYAVLQVVVCGIYLWHPGWITSLTIIVALSVVYVWFIRTYYRPG